MSSCLAHSRELPTRPRNREERDRRLDGDERPHEPAPPPHLAPHDPEGEERQGRVDRDREREAGEQERQVAGAGWTKKQKDGATHVKDAERLILGFLGVARASLGSSKSLTDQSSEGAEVMSFMSHLNQVGQTGSTPRHRNGLATFCHGEEPHVVGWRFISERRAINLDATCGWAQGKADVLYVADAFVVRAKVNELLAADA